MSKNASNGENEDWWKFKWDVKRRPVTSIIDEKGKFDKNSKSGENGAFGEHLPEGWRKFKWDIKLTGPLLSGEEFDENRECLKMRTHTTAKMKLRRSGKILAEIKLKWDVKKHSL